MVEEYKFYDGKSLQITRDIIVEANQTIEVTQDDEHYEFVKNDNRFTKVESSKNKKQKKTKKNNDNLMEVE